MRRFIIAGNWKLNCVLQEAIDLFTSIEIPISTNVEVMVIPPYIYLDRLKTLPKGGISIAAQNCALHESGAYTGEISIIMLKSIGIEHVLIGHSERREIFHENNEIIKGKIDLALKHQAHIIFCCGEPIEIRNRNEHVEYVKNQIANNLGHLEAQQLQNMVIAYEPIWAIGTGVTASAGQAQDMHKEIRKYIAELWNNDISQKIRILYGGSLNKSNAKELLSMPDIDGGLIGGASLKADEFSNIIKIASNLK